MKRLFTIIAFAASVMVMQAQRFVGGDISLLDKYETNGALYYDHDGNAITSPLDYFKNEGLNSMRVRLFVNPANATDAEKGEGVCQDLEFVKKLGKRIKDAGFSLVLDFHYSDTWADPAKQYTPTDWLALDDEALKTKIYEYTKECLTQMVAAGATPDFIQTGNEISYGLLWGDRNASSSWKRYYAGQSGNAERFVALLRRAGQACREVCPKAKIVLHTERVPDASYLTNFYTDMKKAGLDYDIIGLSYYPYYHGNLDKLEKALTSLEGAFPDKKIMIVETGYYHAWQPTDVSYDFSATYPINDEGQKLFTDALIDRLRTHGSVIGLYWWFMEANEYGLDWSTKRVTDGWYNAGLFDNQTGRAMAAMSSLKDFLDTSAGINGVKTSATSPHEIYSLDGRRLSESDLSRGGLYIIDGKKVVK